MSASISVLVLARPGTNHIGAAVEQLRRQQQGPHEIVVLHCPSTAAPTTLARLQALWHPPEVRWIAVPSERPGSARNAGIEASSGEAVAFLDAGETVDPRYVQAAAARLISRPDLGFVTSWWRGPGSSGLDTLLKPEGSLEGLLSGREDIPGPTVVRRSAWAAIGGFDADLPAAEWYDFWIRLLAHGVRGAVIEQELIHCAPSRESAYRRDLGTPKHLAGMRRVFEKHVSLFRRHMVAVLGDREGSLKVLARQYHRLLRQRDTLVPEREALLTQLQHASRRLRELNQGTVDWGDLRRLLPLSADWGYDRGTPIDRYYIERFLAAKADDVHGVVLEVQEGEYSRRFGGDRVAETDVIDITPDNARANLVSDLRRLDNVPSDRYDCIILTQTMHVIDDMRAVLAAAARVLKPGGALLATLPCTSRVCLEYGEDGDFWRVTEAGARQIFSAVFPTEQLEIQSFGNVLTNVAFLQGLATHEISAEEFETHDPFHPLLVGVRAVKPSAAGGPFVARPLTPRHGAILLYHRIAEAQRDIHDLCVKPDAFRAQMEHLAAQYHPVPLVQLAMAAREGWLPDRAVAISFDDGYADNLEVASRILLELGIPATFFVTSEGLQGRAEAWWDALGEIFFGSTPLPSRLFSASGDDLPTSTPEERKRTHWVIYHRIRAATTQQRDAHIAHLKEWAGFDTAGRTARLINREELWELGRRPGHSIGGHGAHHLSFSAHAPDVVRADIAQNRALLEQQLGRIVMTFAYPFGDCDANSVEAVRAAGYRAAATCEEELLRPGADPLRLPRISVSAREGHNFTERLRDLFANAVRASN
jgi:peptidoglycan/xylan/chitin deacetylase (PgdA/CDA1 family)/glycosyltransferase involved in cell wall biosynthesis